MSNEEIAKILDSEEQFRQFGKGKMVLSKPFQDGQNEIKELHWDFTELTGVEYVDAMDADIRAVNKFHVTNRQALELFAVAVSKATPGVDVKDIYRGIGMTDAQKATQIASVFFDASSREGNKNIYNE